MKAERSFTGKNPSGIYINDGYYALLGAILGMTVDEALHKVCGIPYGGERIERQKRGGERAIIDKKVLRSVLNCKALSYRDVGELMGCSYGKIASASRGTKQPVEFIAMLENVLGLDKDELIKKGDVK